MKRSASLVLLLVASGLSAQTSKSWLLSLEERIALRTNPELARQRLHDRGQMRVSATSLGNPAAVPFVDSFDGRTHPELFLPHEVFGELIKLAFSESSRTGQVVREGFVPAVKRHGLPPDFWSQLQSVSAVYIADLLAVNDIRAGARQKSGPARERGEKALALRSRDLCRSRAEALTAARTTFGRERFDRFLYEVIAVNEFYAADRLPDPRVLRNAEEGCR